MLENSHRYSATVYLAPFWLRLYKTMRTIHLLGARLSKFHFKASFDDLHWQLKISNSVRLRKKNYIEK